MTDGFAEGLPLVRGAALDHVAVAIRDPEPAVKLFRDVLGAEFLMGADNVEQGFRFIQYRFPGGGKVEFVTPIAEGSFVAKFLERRGEGVHHVTFKVRDIERQVARLREAEVSLTLVSLEHAGWKEAFIHPSHAHGVLIQLAQSALPDDEVAKHLAERFPEAALLSLDARRRS